VAPALAPAPAPAPAPVASKEEAETTSRSEYVWWCELAIMLFENGLFVSFVTGMASGL
jgi:hypothetical protein